MHVLISAVSSARQPSGICRHAANLANILADAQEISRATLLVGCWQRRYFRDAFGLSSSKAEVIAVDLRNNPYARNVWYHFRLPEIARAYEANVVHLSFPVPIRRSAFASPVVLSLHDLYPYDAPLNFGRIRVLFNRAFLRQCLKASDAVVCSSDFTLNRLRLRTPSLASLKAMRIYQSVALDPQETRAPTNSKLRAQPFLLAVAQHRSNKNLDLLLSAFAEFRRFVARDSFQLVIVGSEGPKTYDLRSLTERLSLQQHVHFLSELTDAKLCWFYRRCELMVVPSSIEGFCFPVAEALRCGSRVLCSDIPTLREIGESRCEYFSLQQCDPPALAGAMNATLQKPAPEPHISDRFRADEIARQYVTLYSTLIKGGRLPAAHTQFCHDTVQ